jgi:tRNA dimethylallyltransferase
MGHAEEYDAEEPQTARRQFDPIIDCWYLTGPTASGKTGVALELARQLDAEIVSLDSMAVYRGMDIGTAKPTLDQRSQVPHHLIDVADPVEEFNVWRYAEAAGQVVEGIRRRGREALFVGGTPLYLKAMLRGLLAGPGADWEFRRQVAEEVKQVGSAALYDRVRQVDPLAASRLDPSDTRRLIRVLEVHKLTGQPLSHLQSQFDEGRPASECRVFVLDWPRPALHKRIESRVDAMFAHGFVAEVEGLLARFGRLGRTASQAVGYREVVEHLQNGVRLEETIGHVKTRTRRFARRQATWFRSLSECRRVACDADATPARLARQIVEAASGAA